MLLVWRLICFCSVKPENTGENQPTTNLKSRISAKIRVFSKKMFSPEDGFSAQICVIKRNDLSNTVVFDPHKGLEAFLEGLQVDILCTQPYCICFIQF